MPDEVRISNLPDSGSKERVAYDLLEKIAVKEADVRPKDRSYWLQLYAECLSVVHGNKPS
ncbi:hypothetical protein [Sphingobium sp. D43FB]|uniref:hypothetical protein n=1 Tax=Sphingobium sp. D43FB TaxID=2017595 RepID=UPI000BB54042|nr:hypothetical protein [Sphingobium sp. D43FB]PBN42499.1 hypothetical protein SxD43FB_16390 [Sphingobium sp. D43FB]